MKKRLFIVGASILQLPAIKAAKDMGLTVAVADHNPKAVGIPYADVYYNVSTIDEIGICAAAKDFRADGIMTVATDMPMRSVGYTCDHLGLCGIDHETAVKATDKGEMIRAFENAGLPCPRYFLPKNENDAVNCANLLGFPLICKPVDNSGSRGVSLVEDIGQLKAAIEYGKENSRGGGVILEEFLRGSEVSVEVIVWNGSPAVLAVTDKETTGAPHFVETGHSQPSKHSAETVEKVEKLAKDAVNAVGIRMGAAHVEIMITDEGPKLIELGARMGGDCITTHLVPLSTGINMIKANIDIALGVAPSLTPSISKGAAIRFVLPEKGTVMSIRGVQTAECMSGVKSVEIMKRPGDMIGDIKNSADRLGFVITQAEDAQSAVMIAEAACRQICAETV